MTPIAISFSDGSNGKVTLTNKRGIWEAKIPSTVSVRKSDDDLKYEAYSEDGRRAVGVIESEMGAKIVASAVFLDLGITDAITDKHRKYAGSFVIPLPAKPASTTDKPPVATAEARLAELAKLKESGMITEEEYAKKRREIVDGI